MSVRFTVIWAEELCDRVAAHWISASSEERTRLTTASNHIDRELRFAPERHGLPVISHSGHRIWRVPNIEPPVVAVFEVHPEDRIVDVVQLLLLPG